MAFMALALASCGGSPAPADLEASTAGPVPSATSDRARVLFLGDSVMATLTPPLRAALGPAGRDARYELYPYLPRASDAVVPSAAEVVGEAEVVVILLGFWQGTSIAGGLVPEVDPNGPRWQTQFRDEFVVPWLQAIRDAGARVVWVGMTDTGDPLGSLGMAEMNGVFRDAVGRVPGTAFVDGRALLTDASGRFQTVDTDPDGDTVRLQATDDLHLCPEGAARIAEGVLALLPADLRAQGDPGWRQREDWADDPFLAAQDWYDPTTCA